MRPRRAAPPARLPADADAPAAASGAGVPAPTAALIPPAPTTAEAIRQQADDEGQVRAAMDAGLMRPLAPATTRRVPAARYAECVAMVEAAVGQLGGYPHAAVARTARARTDQVWASDGATTFACDADVPGVLVTTAAYRGSASPAPESDPGTAKGYSAGELRAAIDAGRMPRTGQQHPITRVPTGTYAGCVAMVEAIVDRHAGYPHAVLLRDAHARMERLWARDSVSQFTCDDSQASMEVNAYPYW